MMCLVKTKMTLVVQLMQLTQFTYKMMHRFMSNNFLSLRLIANN